MGCVPGLQAIPEYDEFERPMTCKEAFKAFLHTFHGKGSGKAKVEKKLKEVASEWQLLVEILSWV